VPFIEPDVDGAIENRNRGRHRTLSSDCGLDLERDPEVLWAW
jgi:hypothetical protein